MLLWWKDISEKKHNCQWLHYFSGKYLLLYIHSIFRRVCWWMEVTNWMLGDFLRCKFSAYLHDDTIFSHNIKLTTLEVLEKWAHTKAMILWYWLWHIETTALRVSTCCGEFWVSLWPAVPPDLNDIIDHTVISLRILKLVDQSCWRCGVFFW